MFDNLTARNREEVARALDRFRFDFTDDGRIHVPGMKLFIGGAFTHSVNGGDVAIDPNIWVNEGLLDLLKCYLNGTTARTSLYIAPYANNVAPTGSLTGATFTSVQGEFTNYTESTRPLWNKGTISALPATNAANAARFTIGTEEGAGTIRGCALLTNSAKSNTAGVMPVCSAFAVARTSLLAGDKLDIEYVLTATSA